MDVAYRLAIRGVRWCSHPASVIGIQWQVISQFAPRDRRAAATAFQLDRGPRILAVAADSPGARAGLEAGDILISVNGHEMGPPIDWVTPVNQVATISAIDALDRRLADSTRQQMITLIILRGGAELRMSLGWAVGCPLHLYIAQSNQSNAYADGLHVLLPRGLIKRISDDDQLALLIAHEMAHNILKHAARLRATAPADRRNASKAQEDEADALGVDITIDAGYDVVRGSRVFLLDGGRSGLSSSHRSGADRAKMAIERVRQHVMNDARSG